MKGASARRHVLAFVALGTLALIWGYNWVLMKLAVQYAPPLLFAAWRILGGAAILFVFAATTRRPLRPEHPRAYALIGAFQTAGFLGLTTWAIVSSGVGKVAMLAYTMPFWVVLLGWPLLGERLRALQGAAIGLAFIGIAFMIGRFEGAWFPDVLALLAGLSWAIAVVLTKRLACRAPIDIFGLTMWQMLFGGILLGAVSLLAGPFGVTWTPTFIIALLYNIILGTAIGYLLWVFVLDVLSARDASMGTLANPIIGAIAAWLQLGERPDNLELIGMLCVIAALVVLSISAPAAASSQPQRDSITP